MEGWLAQKGININENLVIDEKCGKITIQQGGGGLLSMFFRQQVSFPYLPIIENFADHFISKGLEQIIMPFASSITFDKNVPEVSFTPLALSSRRAGTEDAPITFDAQKELNQYDFFTSSLVLAAAVEGKLSGNSNSKLLVYGDGDFIVNGEGQQAQRQAEDNINFFSNGMDWLSNDTGLSELRTKAVTNRPIKRELTDGKRQLVKLGNFLLPIILIVLYGLFRMNMRKRKKRKWANERYV